MLGILLAVLKIIGIILLTILIIIIALTAIILLVPIRYRGKVSYIQGKFTGNLRISWLLSFVSVRAGIDDGKSVFLVNILGKRIYPKGESNQQKNGNADASECESEPKIELPQKDSRIEKIYEPINEDVASKKELPDGNDVLNKNQGMDVHEVKIEDFEHGDGQDENIQKKESAKNIKEKKIKNPFTKLLGLKEKLFDLKEKVMKAEKKAEYWKKLLMSDSMKKALSDLTKTGKRFLQHVLPKRLEGDIHIGFEDPSVTGKILAYLALLYPFTGDALNVEADFENKILEGKLKFSGRIRLGAILYFALTIILNKNICCQYKRLKQGGKKDGERRK